MPATRPRPIAPRASTAPAGQLRKCGSGCGSSCWPMSAWSGCPMPASRPSSMPSPTPRRKSGPMPSPRSAPSSGWSATAGAAEGAGVGDRFLGHIERCQVLLHLVDANDEDVATSYRVVRDELDAYGAGLADKPVVVALNKIDTLDDELIVALTAELAEASGAKVYPLSAAGEIGIEPVLDALLDRISAEHVEDDGPGEPIEWSPI